MNNSLSYPCICNFIKSLIVFLFHILTVLTDVLVSDIYPIQNYIIHVYD
jgi:hypothetical protein